MTQRTCKVCFTVKDESTDFYRNNKYYAPTCKACVLSKSKKKDKEPRKFEALGFDQQDRLRAALSKPKSKIVDICREEDISYFTLKKWMKSQGI